jgi:NAD(P)-dependent dehydrogenase (short-subunit alcohol dehydrogenase family)
VNARSLDGMSDQGVERFSGDLTAPHVAEQVVAGAQQSLGGLDAVIHCAGVGLIKPTLETSDADFTRIMNVNARGTFLVAREACRAMSAAGRGLFVTIPGTLGRAAMKNAAAYCASKYAVTGMVKCFAQEFQRSGLRFSLIHFGGVDTPFWNDIGMNVLRDRLIPVAVAADMIWHAINVPEHLVPSEVVLQPVSHQII